ncbi:Ig-like domain-containing protein [Anaerosporobacter faecicola]|uniref:Ig-like domain-containing protein n=1 Tax=Anaerosporobacter faecicola TaxID=2718714 RepID=UPI0014391414|nr:Ig-like domain-containing protein [Anaerosporobacter faecicola]
MNIKKKNGIFLVIIMLMIACMGLPGKVQADETTNTYIVDKEKELAVGESFQLQLPYGINYSYSMVGDSNCIMIQPVDYMNSLLITASYQGEVTIYITFFDSNGIYIATDSCTITVVQRGLQEEQIVCAVGQKKQIQLMGYQTTQSITYSSSNPGVATIDAQGLVTGVAQGYTSVTVTVVQTDGSIATYSCSVSISNPQMAKTEGNLAVGCTEELVITGLQPESTVVKKTSKASVAEVWEYSNTIYAVKKGSAKITLEVDGVTLTYTVTVTDPKVNVNLLTLVKGKKSTLKVSGINKKSTVTFQSSKSSVAKVDKNGKVTGKKNGCACVTIAVDGKVMEIPVTVGSTKVIGALRYGIKAVGTPYSQAKRMQNGYYDCSSLTWRSYHSVGVNIGSKYWAPTAADMAKTLVKNKKAVAYKALPASELKPGDLLFFTKTDGTDNGRYKNIYHVGIYLGTYDDGSENGLLIEARLSGVGIFTYCPSDRKVAVVARPTK